MEVKAARHTTPPILAASTVASLSRRSPWMFLAMLGQCQPSKSRSYSKLGTADLPFGFFGLRHRSLKFSGQNSVVICQPFEDVALFLALCGSLFAAR